jgi:hypothetical protein
MSNLTAFALERIMGMETFQPGRRTMFPYRGRL